MPLITQFDPKYLEGRVDTLRQSEAIIKSRFWPVFGMSLLFFLLGLFESYKYVFPPESPIYMLLVAVNLFLEVYVYMFFFSVYERLSI